MCYGDGRKTKKQTECRMGLSRQCPCVIVRSFDGLVLAARRVNPKTVDPSSVYSILANHPKFPNIMIIADVGCFFFSFLT